MASKRELEDMCRELSQERDEQEAEAKRLCLLLLACVEECQHLRYLQALREEGT